MNLEGYAACKQEIKFEMRINKDYLRAIFLLNKLEDQIFLESTPYDLEQKWYVFYDRAYCYNILNQYDISNKYLAQSLEYTTNKIDENYLKSLWLIADNYYYLNDLKSSKKYYHKACEYYKFNDLQSNRILMLLNIASLDNNMRRVFKIVKAFVNLEERYFINNKDINIDTIIEQILNTTKDIMKVDDSESNSFFYKMIEKTLYKSKIPMMRKKLLALTC